MSPLSRRACALLLYEEALVGERSIALSNRSSAASKFPHSASFTPSVSSWITSLRSASNTSPFSWFCVSGQSEESGGEER